MLTMEQLEENFATKRAVLSEEEYDKYVSEFWEYFHKAYC